MKEIIETYSHEGQGYNPFLMGEKWQVAMLNYAPAEALEAIDKLDVHYLTDEVFVLLQGHAVLIGAAIDKGIIEYNVIDMLPNKVYNIPKNVWHKIAMSEGSQVLIVEDARTHLGDFEFYHLNEGQKTQLRNVVNEQIKKRKKTL